MTWVTCAQISERIWSLWPQIHQCYHEWAIDYFEHILVPIDNFITRSTETFLSNPTYLQQVCSHALRLHLPKVRYTGKAQSSTFDRQQAILLARQKDEERGAEEQQGAAYGSYKQRIKAPSLSLTVHVCAAGSSVAKVAASPMTWQSIWCIASKARPAHA